MDKDLLKFLNLEELVLSANQIQEVDAVNLPPSLKVKEPRLGLRASAAQPRAWQRWATFLPTCSFPWDPAIPSLGTAPKNRRRGGRRLLSASVHPSVGHRSQTVQVAPGSVSSRTGDNVVSSYHCSHKEEWQPLHMDDP